MKILITGTSKGIGLGIAKKFLEKGHTVFGFDTNEAAIVNPNYNHYLVDIRDVENYPEIPNVEVLVNNAGVQSEPPSALWALCWLFWLCSASAPRSL